jgi:hypothetical protein
MGAKFGSGMEFTTGVILGIILNRAFIGFTIGVSGWRTHWAFHGVVIGLLGTLPLAVYAIGDPRGLRSFLLMEVAGAVWGLLIELGALAVKAKKKA